MTAPASDAATDMTFTFQPGACLTFFGGGCPGTSATDAVSASLWIDAVPEPGTLLRSGWVYWASQAWAGRFESKELGSLPIIDTARERKHSL